MRDDLLEGAEAEWLAGRAERRGSAQIAVGMPVFDNRDQRVGPVETIHGGFFKIDALWDPDLWLSVDLVADLLDGDLVILSIGFNQLDSWKAPRLLAA